VSSNMDSFMTLAECKHGWSFTSLAATNYEIEVFSGIKILIIFLMCFDLHLTMFIRIHVFLFQ
jgi:hypothetical protein